jgi:hypothetical protein
MKPDAVQSKENREVDPMLENGSHRQPAFSPSSQLMRSLWLSAHAMQKSRRARRGAGRRGQALLLAVLLMIFVALLGSTFVTVVALNMSQTERQEDLTVARSSARAGLEFINTNLTYSPEGDKWRPERISPPPAPSDPDYALYYSPFERAQGWARTVDHPTGWNAANPDYAADWAALEEAKTNGARVFVKIPDPRTRSLPPGTPTYLAEVKTFPTNQFLADGVTPNPNYDAEKAGMVRIEVIGRSDEQTSVFERRVAFKGGYRQNPLTAAARSVTNWDFVNNTVPSGQFVSAGSTTSALVVTRLNGEFPTNLPFYVLIGNPGTGNTLRSALVASVSGTGANRTLTLANPLAALPTNGERVEMAAGLGAPATIDFDNDKTPNTATEQVAYRASAFTTGTGTPGNFWINGSLLTTGNTFMMNLRSPNAADATNPAGVVKVSGLIGTHIGAGTFTNPATPKVQNAYYNNGGSVTKSAIDPLVSSTDANFPFTGAVPTNEKLALVQDGSNRLLNRNDATQRQVAPFTPPSISTTSGNTDISRYRQLTKFSAPATSGVSSTASLYGYGQGIYIDNPQDIERVFNSGRYAPMTTSQLREMWFTPGDPTVATPTNRTLRLSRPLGQGTSTPTGARNGSLEEKHLRGWIGPDEFRARGALIELAPNYKDPVTGTDLPSVFITRDTLNDAAFNANVPVAEKGWKDNAGTLDGTFKKRFDWPVNGVIFAEGNVRVKGGAFKATGEADTTVNPANLRNITIVSMNNIYIDGSLNAGARKVLLLAKKHVVMNPTAVINRVEAQTRVVSTTGATLEVQDGSLFRRGDWIIEQSSNPEYAQIIAEPSGNTLTLNKAFGTLNAGDLVRAVPDPFLGGGADAYPYFSFATRLGQFNDFLQRRVFLPGDPAQLTQIRLAFRHNAQKVPALQVHVDSGTTPPTEKAELSNKLVSGRSSIIPTNQKLLRVTYEAPTSTPEWYPKNASSAEPANDAEAELISLLNMHGQLPQSTVTTPPPPPLNFKPATTVLNKYDDPGKQPRFYFLAAIGNRYGFGQPTGLVPPSVPPQDVLAAPFSIPMGTSVQLSVNGVPSRLINDRYVGTTPESVRQFGFSPRWGDFATNPAEAFDDALTIDQSFYQNISTATTPPGLASSPNNDNMPTYTLDARRVTLAANPDGINSLALHFSRDEVVPGTGRILDDYFNATNAPIPYYRLSRLKIDGPTFVDRSGTPTLFDPFNTTAPTPVFEEVRPYPIQVNAFVYAQEGSWVVLPGGVFDENLIKPAGIEGSYLEINGTAGAQPGEFLDVNGNGSLDNGEYADLNRDGEITREEKAGVYRFHRYNYKINFTGSITEHVTMPVFKEGTTVGAVQEWTDRWSTVTLTSGNWSGTGVNDSLNAATLRSDINNPSTGSFDSVTYNFDPSILVSGFNDAGFVAPQLPDLIYQG